jgi:hypothetical protein
MTSNEGFDSLSDRELVERIRQHIPTAPVHAGVAEMQRRHMEVLRDFNRQSSRQASIMIWLTVLIAVLTIVIAVLTAVMIWR